VKLLSALATAAAAVLLVAAPAAASPPAAAAASFVLSTGVTEGQLIGNNPTIRPVFAEGVELAKVEVLFKDVVKGTFDAPIPPALTFYLTGFHEQTVPLTVRAYDVDGNVGEASTPVRIDLRAPLTYVQPAANAVIGATTPIQFSSRDGDLARIEIRDMAGNTLAQTTQAPWVLNWDTRPFNGFTKVRLIIRDGADNNWDMDRTYFIDNVGPEIASILPEHNTLIRGSTVTRIFAGDASGLITISVRDGQPTADPLRWIVNPTEQGPYTIVWTIADRRGYSTTGERVVINDTVGADLRITEAPEDGSALTEPVEISAEATDLNGVDRVELVIDGTVVATDTESDYRFTLDPENHGTNIKVQLRAYDRAGNETTSSELTYHR
jgi:hypothetical protein